MTHGLVSGMAVGRISSAEVLRIYERTVRRLTAGVGPPATSREAGGAGDAVMPVTQVTPVTR